MIRSDTDFENPANEPFDAKSIMWYTVKANLMETKREQEEKLIAIKKQMAMGIIQPNGLPAGIDPAQVGMTVQTVRRPPQPVLRQNNSNMAYLNRPKPTPQQLFQQRFGIRK